MSAMVVSAAMDPERWRRAFSLFHDAIARDAGERGAFLSAACLGDDEMCQAAEQLVSAHEAAGDFLEVPAAVLFLADARGASSSRNSEKPAFLGVARGNT